MAPPLTERDVSAFSEACSTLKVQLGRLRSAVVARTQQEDKRLHAGWSFWLTLAAGTLLSLSWSAMIVLGIGVAKECWDHFKGTGFCVVDLAANAVGIAAAALILAALPLPFCCWQPWLP